MASRSVSGSMVYDSNGAVFAVVLAMLLGFIRCIRDLDGRLENSSRQTANS